MRTLFWRITPVVIWILAIVTLGEQLTVRAATFAGVLGCVAAFWIGARLASSRIRLWVPWALVLPVQAIILLIGGVLRDVDLTSRLLGPANAWLLSAMLVWFCSSALWVGVFQASSRRLPPFVALESAAITMVGAAIFSQHRDGFINRPFFLVDPLWAKGYDPLPIFLAIGGAVAAILVLLLASKSASASRRSTILDVAVLMIFMLVLYAVFPTGQIKNWRDLQSGGQGKGKASPSPGERKEPAGKESKGGKDTTGKQGKSDIQEMKDGDFRQENDAPVAVVVLRDDYTPPEGFYYFRQSALSLYNGKRLARDSGNFDRDLCDGFPTDSPTRLPIERASSAVVRQLETEVALITTHSLPFGLLDAFEFASLNNPDPTYFQRAYTVRSDVLTVDLRELLSRPVGSSKWDPETWKHYTEAPTDPRYAKLAETCTAILSPKIKAYPLARALAVQLWLGQNGTYDLSNRYDGSEDPVGDFLFGNRIGYCVSFSHAGAALYRTVGVPSRVAQGYMYDARFRGSSSALLIRGSASHAWPEIYLEGVGWIALDISPAKSLIKPSPPPDPSQQNLYGDLARKKGKMPDKKPLGNGNVQEWLRELLRGIPLGLLYGLLLGLLAMYVVKVKRRLDPLAVDPRRLPLVVYRSVLDALADLGKVRAYGQTREDFARQQADVCPSLIPLTALHLQHSLGREKEAPAPEQLKRLWTDAQREIAANTRPGRRLLALLNPLGWWLVK